MAIIAIYVSKSIHPISKRIRQNPTDLVGKSVCVFDNKRMKIGAKRTHAQAQACE